MKLTNSNAGLEKIADEFDWSEADALTDEQLTQNALDDPDAQPVGEDWFKRAAARREALRKAAE